MNEYMAKGQRYEQTVVHYFLGYLTTVIEPIFLSSYKQGGETHKMKNRTKQF
jgi:hypothetical protein